MKDIMNFDLAEPYQSGNMGTFGKAQSMLICQNNFPLTYDIEKDKCLTGYLDRLKGFDPVYIDFVLKKYKTGNLEYFLRSKESEVLHVFICDLLKQDSQHWTGYRVLGSVGGNGHAYYLFQLFFKHPESDTEVYSEDDAPNVLDG